MQREIEALTVRLAEAENAKAVANKEATAAKAQAAQLVNDKAFYEASARDKEDLNNLLRDKVATLQEDVLSMEEKTEYLQKENDALRAEVAHEGAVRVDVIDGVQAQDRDQVFHQLIL